MHNFGVSIKGIAAVIAIFILFHFQFRDMLTTLSIHNGSISDLDGPAIKNLLVMCFEFNLL